MVNATIIEDLYHAHHRINHEARERDLSPPSLRRNARHWNGVYMWSKSVPPVEGEKTGTSGHEDGPLPSRTGRSRR